MNRPRARTSDKPPREKLPIHAVTVELLEAHPEALAYLLSLIGAPPGGSLIPVTGTLVKVAALERRIDRVFLIGDREAPQGFVLTEVQTRIDPDKSYAWPLYMELARSRYRCEGVLVVLTFSEDVRRWIERDIIQPTGIYGGRRQLEPLVLALDQIDTSLLLRPDLPHLARLAVAARARAPNALEVVKEAVQITQENLPERLARDQLDAIIALVGEALRPTVEELIMERSQFKSETFRRWFDEATAAGRAEGRAEGKAEGEAKGEARGKAEGEARGKAEAVLSVLDARGIPVSEVVRARILGCKDIATLGVWVQRAATASSAAAVVRASKPVQPRAARRAQVARGQKKR